MTPELKIACELVFQEHKAASQIKWSREVFRGRISIGLSEMAKHTLVKKHIILLPDKSKKIITLLNPAIAAAGSFEEAEEMIGNKTTTLVSNMTDDHSVLVADQPPGFEISRSGYPAHLLAGAGQSEIRAGEIKWYFRPLFYYVIWPFCALAAGALIAFLLGLAYTELFLDMK
jgi:hypothetical protein